MENSESVNENNAQLFQANGSDLNSAAVTLHGERNINIQDIPVIEEVTVEINSSVLTSQNNNPNLMEVDAANEENRQNQGSHSNENAKDATKSNVYQLDTSEEMDPGALCSICYSPYTNSGEHRLSCLKCGHLFGNSCILHWLKTGCHHSARRCPSCNEKASLRDVRILYAKNLVAYDTTEKDRLLEKLRNAQNEKNKLESQVSSSNLKIEMLQTKIKEHEDKIKQLTENTSSNEQVLRGQKSYSFSSKYFQSFNLCSEGGCRVLAYSSHLSLLLAAQPSNNPLFPGHGVRKINSYDMRLCSFHPVHKKTIRDMNFSPHDCGHLLSVSLDCTAKLFDVQSNTVIQTFPVSEPLWSCCWSSIDPNKFFCGSQSGTLFSFDRRQPRGEPELVSETSNTTDKSAILSLCSIPPRPGRLMPSGGILACRLNCVSAFYSYNQKFQNIVLPIDGAFMSMRYNESTDHLLISARPNSRWTTPRHIICQLSKLQHDEHQNDIVDVLHTFYGVRCTNILSRSALVPLPNGDQLICAYNALHSTIDAWSMISEKKLDIRDHYISEPVFDICSFQVNDNAIMLPCLSEKKLSVIQLNLESNHT